MVSEEMGAPFPIRDQYPNGRYLLAFDPLDGSLNIDVNVSVGSIFSIHRAAAGGGDAQIADFLKPGAAQVCAGYAIYGPSTTLVISVGRGVQGFTLAPQLGELFLTHPTMTNPAGTSEFAINASNSRFWEPAVRRYVGDFRAARISTCDGWRRWSPRRIASSCAAGFSSIRATTGTPQSPDACGYSTKPRPSPSSSSRPRAARLDRPRQDPRHRADEPAPAGRICFRGA
jgi:fructose-1,6-bisphosphatase